MPKALTNPIGLEAPTGVKLVRVGSVNGHTHAFDPEAGGLLCRSGKGRRGKPIELFGTDARQVTCYRCQKLLRYSDLLPRTFSPSHPEPRGDWPGNRDLHLQLPGGRHESRYKTGNFDRISTETQTRLDDTNEPEGRRTQSPETLAEVERREPIAKKLSQQIRSGLDTYRAGRPELTVPSVPTLLVSAGVPIKPANILVARKAGKTIVSKPPGISVPLKAVMRSSLTTDEAGRPSAPLGSLRLKGSDLVATIDGQPWPISRIRIETAGEEGDSATLLTASELGSRLMQWQRAHLEGAEFLDKLLSDLDMAARSFLSEPAESPVLTIFFVSGKAKKQRSISLGEHSNFLPVGARVLAIEYRSLRDVSLEELPRLLARLSLRKKREGRKLPRLTAVARSNPSVILAPTEQDGLAALFVGPDGKLKADAKPIPVPGQPGKVYVWSQAKKAVVTTTPARAAAWAQAGARARVAWGSAPTASSATPSIALENTMSRARHNMAGRPGLHGLPTIPVGRSKKAKGFAQMSAAQLAADGSQGAIAELTRRQASRGLRAKKKRPASRASVIMAPRRPAKANRGEGMKVDWNFADDYGQRFAPQYDPFGLDIGQFGAQKFVPVNRRNPKKKAPAKKSRAKKPASPKAAAWRQTFAAISRRAQQIQAQRSCHYKTAFDQASQEIRGGARARANGLALTNGLGYGGLAFTNPKGGMTVSRFPGDCCVCGQTMVPGSQICDSGMRGPKGGVKMKHGSC